MHHQGRQVGNRIYYGNYHGGLCTPQNRNRCLLILLTILLLLSGFIVTIVGFTVEPFWSEQDASWCSFCKEGREKTLRNTANCRIAGPIFLGLGVLLLVFTIWYAKKIKNDASNEGTPVTMMSAPTTTTLSYGSAFSATTTTIHHPPGQNPPQQPYPTTQYNPSPQPPSQPYPPPNQFPPVPPSQHYPLGQNLTQSSYPLPTAPEMPPPPSYNDATGLKEKF